MTPPDPQPEPSPSSGGRSANEWVKLIVTSFLVFVPMVAWIWFVIAAGAVDHSPSNPPNMNDQVKLVGVASGTALSVIAGSFLGISNSLGQMSIQGLDTGPGSWWGRVRAGMRLPRLSVSAIATLVYFVGIVIAVVIWAIDKNRDNSVDVIQTSLATLVGFGLGALKAATTMPA